MMPSHGFMVLSLPQNLSLGTNGQEAIRSMFSYPQGDGKKYENQAEIHEEFLNTLQSISLPHNQAKSKITSDEEEGHTAIRQKSTNCPTDLFNLLGLKNQVQPESGGFFSEKGTPTKISEDLNHLKALEIGLLLKHVNDASPPTAAEDHLETNTKTPFEHSAELIKRLGHHKKAEMIVPPSGLAFGDGSEIKDNSQLAQTAELAKLLENLHDRREEIASSEIRSLLSLLDDLDVEGNSQKTWDPITKNAIQRLIAKSDAPNLERETQNGAARIPIETALNAGKANSGDILREFTATAALLNTKVQSFAQVDEKTPPNLNADHLEKNLIARGQSGLPPDTVNSSDHLKVGYFSKSAVQNSISQNFQHQDIVQGTQKQDGVGNPDRMNLGLTSDTGSDDKHQSLSKNERAVINSGQPSNIQAAHFKTEFSMNEGIGSKGIKSDLGNKDGSPWFVSHQTEVISSESRIPVKDAEMAQKELPARILDQLVQKAVIHLRNGQSEVKIDLKPDFMGQIRMQIITENQQVTVRILTEFPFVKDLIENNFHQLKLELQNQGLKVDELDVSVADEPDQQTDDHPRTFAPKTPDSADKGQPSGNSQLYKTIIVKPKTNSSRNETIIDYFA